MCVEQFSLGENTNIYDLKRKIIEVGQINWCVNGRVKLYPCGTNVLTTSQSYPIDKKISDLITELESPNLSELGNPLVVWAPAPVNTSESELR